MTDQYIVGNKISWSKRGGDRVLQWSKKFIRYLDRAVCWITCLYYLYLYYHYEVRVICRVQKGYKKGKKKFSNDPVFKYGIEVPNNPQHSMQLDEKNSNIFCKDAIDKEIKALLQMDCFEFHPAGYHMTLIEGWQRTTLHMVFGVKQSLQLKFSMVAGGHLVDMLDIQVYSSTVKSICMQLLRVISHKANLEQLCVDIGNEFPNSYTNKEVYIQKDGIQFGGYAGKLIVISRSLYGLCFSS